MDAIPGELLPLSILPHAVCVNTLHNTTITVQSLIDVVSQLHPSVVSATLNMDVVAKN